MLTNREIILYLSLLYKGDWDKIYKAIQSKEYSLEDPIIIGKIKNLKCGYITILDPEYPDYFRLIPRCPFVLYYYGDISLLDTCDNNMAVIGTRKPSAYGLRATEDIVHSVANHFVIISGLAKGIDAAAHRAALDVGGRTIAILGSGIDYCYPIENKKLYDQIKADPKNLIISEYPGETVPSQITFPLRNRFIAAFSKGVIITEAYQYSGTSITATFALSLQRPIMVVPSEAFKGSLCNELVNEGARLINEIQDIYDEIGFSVD